MRIRLSLGLLMLLVLAISLPLQGSAHAQEGGPIYVVEVGDTLAAIALRFGVSVEALVQANGIADPSLLQPGMRLRIPGYEGVEGVLDTRPLSFGESLGSVALRSGLPIDRLARLNRIVNPQRMYVGQEIIYALQEEATEGQDWRGVGVPAGATALEMAVREGVNPWSLFTQRGSLAGGLLAPENAVWLPSSSDTGGLPAPLKEFVVRPQRVLQGRTVVVEFWSEAPVRATGRLGAWDLRFHEAEEGHWVALQGVHAMATPGLYDLKVDLAISGAHDWGFWHLQPMRVASGGYRYDPVLLVPEETIDPKNTEPENELILDVVSEVTLEKYWSGPFAFPSNYTEAFPSLFGSRRNYNNTGYTAYHTGLDFYGGEGSDVFAPAPGEVVLAAELEVRGNVTFIDHGWGVYTGYLHQSEILVARGEWVETGQVIGKVGSTGRVTGPHLHWEIWVGGVPVDPLEWVATSFP